MPAVCQKYQFGRRISGGKRRHEHGDRRQGPKDVQKHGPSV